MDKTQVKKGKIIVDKIESLERELKYFKELQESDLVRLKINAEYTEKKENHSVGSEMKFQRSDEGIKYIVSGYIELKEKELKDLKAQLERL